MDTKRFHHPEYKKQIHAVRTHKRHARPKPEGRVGKFLEQIGLGTWFRRIVLFVTVVLVIYFVYFANFLMLNNLEVNGADPQTTAQLKEDFKSFLATKKAIFPEHNILFFNASGFGRAILAGNFSISSISSIHRKPFRTVQISVVERVPAFNFQSQNQFFLLNSDGNLSSEIPQADPKYPLLVDLAQEQGTPGENIFSSQKYRLISYLNENFSHELGVDIDHFEIPTKTSLDLVVYSKSGFKTHFDATQDGKVYLGRLFTIWASLSPQQRQKLSYVDLRFDPNAYVCYKGDACANSAAQTPVK